MFCCSAIWTHDLAFHIYHYHNTPGYVTYDNSHSRDKNLEIFKNSNSPIVNVGKEWGKLKK